MDEWDGFLVMVALGVDHGSVDVTVADGLAVDDAMASMVTAEVVRRLVVDWGLNKHTHDVI